MYLYRDGRDTWSFSETYEMEHTDFTVDWIFPSFWTMAPHPQTSI